MEDISKLGEKEYRALPYESFSSIKHILESPIEWQRNKDTPFKGSPATDLGTAIHHYIQGNKHLVAVHPFSTKKSVGYAEWEADFFERVGSDGIVITPSLEAKVMAIMSNFNANSNAIALIEFGICEVPFLFELSGMKFKGKTDFTFPSTKKIVEIKSTGSCEDAWSFHENAVIAKHYDMQAFMYLEGIGVTEDEMRTGEAEHFFIVALTKPPYSVNTYRLSFASYMRGKLKALRAVADYKKYIINKLPYTPAPVLEEV